MIDIVNENKLVKTRKAHQCHYCMREFPKGSDMYVSILKGDYDIYSLYQCRDCYNFLTEASHNILDEILYDDGYEEGCIREFLAEHGFTIEKANEFLEYWER